MRKTFIAGLLSAFVAPGSGHFYLKHQSTALVFFSLALISLMLLLVPIYQLAQVIALDIQNGALAFDIAIISAEITQQTQTTIANATGPLYSFVACWLVALVDSIRLGLKQDKQDKLAA